MIVPNLTVDELLYEMREDQRNLMIIADHKQKKVDRIILHSATFPVRVHTVVTTRRHNKWVIMWEAKTRKYIGDDTLITLMCIHNSRSGRYGFMPGSIGGHPIVMEFAPHFFSRFAQRMGINLTGDALIKRYAEINFNFAFTEKYEETEPGRGVMNIYGSSAEGVAMGLISADGKLILFKTFVSYDMLKGKQVETFAATEQIRKEIHEQETDISRIP